MRVLKFGGTSMGTYETWKTVLDLAESKEEPILVVSATSKTTNKLVLAADQARNGDIDSAHEISNGIKQRHIQLVEDFFKHYANGSQEELLKEARQYIKDYIDHLDNYLLGINTLGELTWKSRDAVNSIGERISSYLLAVCGQALGLHTEFVDSRKIIKTDDTFGKANARIDEIHKSSELLQYMVEENKIPIMGGFYGSTPDGVISTLGRGGSDYSASLVASALKAEALEIWTDVSGMYTSDPREVDGAYPISRMSYNEAAELAYFGARVLHPATIEPAVKQRIPVLIKNTFSPEDEGTYISQLEEEDVRVTAVAYREPISVITINSSRMLMAYGFLEQVFQIFKKYRVSVDVVTTSEVSVSVTVDTNEHIDDIVNDLRELGEVYIQSDQALITLVGHNFLQAKGIARQIFNSMPEDVAVRMISQGSSDNNVTMVIDNSVALNTVNKLHQSFFNQS